jgi:hypothetical protein
MGEDDPLAALRELAPSAPDMIIYHNHIRILDHVVKV